MFWLVPIVSVVAFALVIRSSRRSWAREHASRLALLDHHAREGVATLSETSLFAPLSGRQALAWHIEVITRERRRKGNVEEILVRRVFEQATGSFALRRDDGQHVSCVLDEAHVIESPVPDSVANATLFVSSTSAFTPGGHVPPPAIGRFLYERGLPMPTSDTMFTPGLRVLVNERIVVPGSRLWFVHGERACFGLGSIAETKRGFALALGDLLFGAALVALLAGGGTAAIVAGISELLSR